MAEPRRGEVWSIDLGSPVGHEQGFRRPALVLSSDRWNEYASKVVVVPFSRISRGLGTRVEVEPTKGNGLTAISYARCEDIRSVSTLRLDRRLGRVGLVQMHAVERALAVFLEI